VYRIALGVRRRDGEHGIFVAVESLAEHLRAEVDVCRAGRPRPLPDVGHQPAVRVREVIGQVTDVIRVREHDREGCRKVRLAAGWPLIAVPVVANIDAGPYPARSAGLRLHDAEQYRLHAEIELRVCLLAVDYVECVRQIGVHVGDLEVEPLMPRAAVYVRRQDQVVLP